MILVARGLASGACGICVGFTLRSRFGAHCVRIRLDDYRLIMKVENEKARGCRSKYREKQVMYHIESNGLRPPAECGMLGARSAFMQKTETMTLDEKLDTTIRAFELLHAGDKEGHTRAMKSVPMPSYLAKAAKDTIGADFLINGGWNLSEAEAEFGRDWLAR